MRKFTEDELKKYNFLPRINVFTKNIERICKKNNFGRGVEDYSERIYIKIRDCAVNLLDKSATPLAVVYLSCKKNGVKTTLEEIDSKAYPFPSEIDKNHLEKMRQKRLERTRAHLKEIQKILITKLKRT